MKHKVDKEDCFRLESLVLKEMDNHGRKSPLERTLLSGMDAKELLEEVSDEEVVQCAHQLEVLKPLFSSTRRVEDLNKSEGGGDETSKVELKPLPSRLKYSFLDETMLNPIIINNELTVVEEEELVKVLREHKSAIGWPIDDLQGISPTMCMHIIYLEDDFKPICQP